MSLSDSFLFVLLLLSQNAPAWLEFQQSFWTVRQASKIEFMVQRKSTGSFNDSEATVLALFLGFLNF